MHSMYELKPFVFILNIKNTIFCSIVMFSNLLIKTNLKTLGFSVQRPIFCSLHIYYHNPPIEGQSPVVFFKVGINRRGGNISVNLSLFLLLYRRNMYKLQNHPTFHSEKRLVNLERGREFFVGLSVLLVYVCHIPVVGWGEAAEDLGHQRHAELPQVPVLVVRHQHLQVQLYLPRVQGKAEFKKYILFYVSGEFFSDGTPHRTV